MRRKSSTTRTRPGDTVSYTLILPTEGVTRHDDMLIVDGVPFDDLDAFIIEYNVAGVDATIVPPAWCVPGGTLVIEEPCDHRHCSPDKHGITEWTCEYWQTDGVVSSRFTVGDVVGPLARYDDRKRDPDGPVIWHEAPPGYDPEMVTIDLGNPLRPIQVSAARPGQFVVTLEGESS